ncbi:hypothetical protein G6F49_009805 [Rhizopus delemar]|nr:hypothetical protein G6F49_009805 [Rhizopus delemar]
MVDLLHDRSLADKVFVSPSSQSTEPIASRDMKDNTSLMARLKNVDGDTQGSFNENDMLKFIRLQGKKPVVITCLTYAGFITKPEILKDFLHYHKNVKYIVIDNCSRHRGFEVLSRQEILENTCTAERFNCRPSVGQRSK